ncbi:hypothetical protein ACFQ78_11945 [Streptomyces sp. NPDC056519]|uniref:hypothetical protein n=1 Tax=Streptomyces sp. NPDC056519 TaxID=3345849 RepID=UPI003687EA83
MSADKSRRSVVRFTAACAACRASDGPGRLLWDECEWGNVHWYCCGNPLEGRALLDRVLLAMTPRSARELRAVLTKYDALWITPYLDRG